MATQQQQRALKLTKSTLTVGSFNVRSLLAEGRLDNLKHDLERFNYDILGLQETRFPGSNRINNNFIYSNKQGQNFHGVGLLMSPRASDALLGFEISQEMPDRLLTATFRAHPHDICVIIAYAPHTGHTMEERKDFYTALQNIINRTPARQKVIVLGDFNARIGKTTSGFEETKGNFGLGEKNLAGDRLLKFARSNELFFANTVFKFKKFWTATWRDHQIDFILIPREWRNAIRMARAFPAASSITDHSLVLANLQLRIRPQDTFREQKKFAIKKLENEDTRNKFKERVTQLLLANQGTSQSLHQRIINSLTHAATEVLGTTQRAKRNWISETTLTLMERRRELKGSRKMSLFRRIEYALLRTQIMLAVKTDKEKFLENTIKEVEEAPHTALKTIGKLARPFQSRPMGLEGEATFDGQRAKLEQYCTDHYKNKFTPPADITQEVEEEVIEKRAEIFLQQMFGIYTDHQILEDQEIDRAINALKGNRAPGPDYIPAELLRQGGPQLQQELRTLIKTIWTTQTLPETFAEATIIPIPKVSNPRTCAQFRTISLINHVCKILTLVLLNRIGPTLEQQLSPFQFGFRHKRSTVDAITVLKLIAEKRLTNNQDFYCAFVDISTAFDSVNRSLLWNILEARGIGGKNLEILKLLYENSTARVAWAGKRSGPFQLQEGVRQGDPLSPILYITYLDRALKTNTPEPGIKIGQQNIGHILFADDMALFAETKVGIQTTLTNTTQRLEKFNQKINRTKTKVMHFNRDHPQLPLPTISTGANGEYVEEVNQFCYLGRSINHRNDDEREIRRRIGLAWATYYRLKKILHTKQISNNLRRKTIMAFTFATLAYGCQAWVVKKADEQRIHGFEHKLYRRILKIRHTDRVTNFTVRQRMGTVTTMLQRIKRIKLQYFGKLARSTGEIKELLFAEATVNQPREENQ